MQLRALSYLPFMSINRGKQITLEQMKSLPSLKCEIKWNDKIKHYIL